MRRLTGLSNIHAHVTICEFTVSTVLSSFMQMLWLSFQIYLGRPSVSVIIISFFKIKTNPQPRVRFYIILHLHPVPLAAYSLYIWSCAIGKHPPQTIFISVQKSYHIWIVFFLKNFLDLRSTLNHHFIAALTKLVSELWSADLGAGLITGMLLMSYGGGLHNRNWTFLPEFPSLHSTWTVLRLHVCVSITDTVFSSVWQKVQYDKVINGDKQPFKLTVIHTVDSERPILESVCSPVQRGDTVVSEGRRREESALVFVVVFCM